MRSTSTEALNMYIAKRFSLFVLLALICSFAMPNSQDAGLVEGARVEPARVIQSMDWLAGDWSGDMWGGKFHAYYSTPTGGKVLSHSRLMHGDELSFYEFEVFEVREETVYLQPYPGGSPADGFDFKSQDSKTKQAVFENPSKDFPTRIVYQLLSKDNLVITLSDPHGGSTKVERFDLKRVVETSR